MESLLSQIFKVLVEPPGNLIYHLVIVFAAMAGLQTVFLMELPHNRPNAFRMKIGFLVIIAGQVFQFVVSALGWQNIIDLQLVLPLLDRALIAVSVIWIGWMVLGAHATRASDTAVGLLTLFAFLFFAYALIDWGPLAGRASFNGSPLDLSWVVMLLLLSVASAILIAYFRPENWGTGFGFFVIVFAGGVVHVLLPYPESDYPAAVRLALICVFPLLPGLAWVLKPSRNKPVEKPRKTSPAAGEKDSPPAEIRRGQLLTSAPDLQQIRHPLAKAELSPAKMEDLEGLYALLAKGQQELSDARQELRLLLEEMDAIRSEPDSAGLDPSLESILAVQQESEKHIAALEAENAALHQFASEQSRSNAQVETNYLEQELHAALEELAHLQNALAEANITIMNLQQRSANPGQLSQDSSQLFQTTLQKLNAPVSSILAYSDLLSGEAIATVNPLLQNFVTRIHESANEIKSLTDELVQTGDQTPSPVELVTGLVAVNPVIDRAVSGISPTLDQKKIDLHLAIPASLPKVIADRDALQQIVAYLLQNAAAVTPANGAISLSAQLMEGERDSSYLVIQVTDEGGGIPEAEVEKVFDKEYRVLHPSVPGIDDRGIGLAITRTLVEAHRGRIWVESTQKGKSTISVLLPIENQPVSSFIHR
ncbi:MAG TPA: hypothetical protein DCP32_07445 [Anaerolineaceae bacterium]|nr:MAG: hypothetical protein A2X24_10240 [Chloroflexi bacterium GWB2_54_36]HAL16573.1 hypothetical protein [Anaerolineaceae bacterium]HBA90525.1 hypothetical protein [Anaerolineaceae bacterium]